MTEGMREELKPCPFCGGAAEFEILALGAQVAMCGDCNSTGPDGSNEAEAITAWNTRTDAMAADKAEIARLREALLAVKPFVLAVAENVADEPIADNGMTVWDGLQNQAPGLIVKISAALEKTDV